MTRKVHVHLVTPVVTKGIRDMNEIAPFARPDLVFSQSELDIGPPSIECEFDEALAVPDTIAKAIAAEQAGADAIIIDCMGDPGLHPVREALHIPVLGPGETTMHWAAMLGHRFSIVTVLESVKPMLTSMTRRYGVDSKFASCRVVDVPVLELVERFAEVQQRLAEQARAAVLEDDAHAIILGCTGFIGCASTIDAFLKADGITVPVLDPIPVTVCMAEAMVRAGLSHSRRTYPTPRPKANIGFAMPTGWPAP